MHNEAIRRRLVVPLLSLTFVINVHASSHREAPYVTQSPKVDATDFYMFNSYEPGREDYVTLIANYLPLQDAYGGPNYFSLDQNAAYDIHIDNDGDAVEDMTFRFLFDNSFPVQGQGVELTIGDQQVAVPLKVVGPLSAESKASANFAESYTLSVIVGSRRTGSYSYATDSTTSDIRFAKPLDYIGEKTFGNADDYTRYVTSLSNSGSVYNDVTIEACGNATAARVFVGQRKDSFSVNLGNTFDLINFDPINIEDTDSHNTLSDKNITTIALEVHKSCLTGAGNGVIGAWTSASTPQIRIINPNPDFEYPEVAGGAWTQVSRLGSPLVNEVVIGFRDKNRFNHSHPSNDAQFATYVTHPTLPAIINLLFNGNSELSNSSIAPSNLPRADLVAAFLTGVAGVNQLSTVTPSEMLRLNTNIAATDREAQNNLGVAAGDVAGFPNGRRPGDDVVDIALRAVMGAFCHELPLDLNADGDIDHNDNLMLCGATSEQSRAAAPVGNVAFRDGAPQNAMQFSNVFPYLVTPIPGSAE